MNAASEKSRLLGLLQRIADLLWRRNAAKLRARDERLVVQNKVLAELARYSSVDSEERLADTLRHLAATAASTLNVERVSIWLLSPDGSEMACQCLVFNSTGGYGECLTLKAADYPRYFATLHEGRGFAVHDAWRDPRTSEFTEHYLRPTGITSLLDVPIRISTQLAGVICHEHIGEQREWTVEEQSFAASIGDMASIAFESAKRRDAERALQAAYANLESQVAKRTEELRLANDRLRELDEAKSNYLRAMSDQLNRTASDFDYLAHHDALTGLANRLFFNNLLDLALDSRVRSGNIAVMLLDLDGFKLINDSMGHVFGDAMLVMLADRINSALPPLDKAARIGSDEFAILIHGVVDREQVAMLAQKLLFAISEGMDVNGEQLSVSASIGIVLAPEDGTDRHGLLKAADSAMYAAKAQGCNRYCFFTPDMMQQANEQHSIEQGLRRAIEFGHLCVHYQPQLELATGKLSGVEALVRWNHPQEGLIPPMRFIPVAERSGLIEHLGRWVLRAACEECMGWLPAYPGPIRLSVNVSARQLVDESFIDDVREILSDTGFPAASLELELTESTLQLIETSPRLLNEIRALGITLAIDDFGTGYSSLSVLKLLPIDRLKIDKSFVRDIPTDPNDIAIIQAIIGICQTLELSIVAEGVETADQLEVLRKLGCEYGQGYFFSRPLPKESLLGWVAQDHKTDLA